MSLVYSAIARKLSAFVVLSKEELAPLEVFYQRRRFIELGQDLVRQDRLGQVVYMLYEGWVCSYKLQSSGSRQIVGFQVPGDIVGLRSILFRISDHSASTLTRVEVTEVSSTDLIGSFANNSRLEKALQWSIARDQAIFVERIVDMGRRNAVERTAHFLLELGARLTLVGLGDKHGYACPILQDMLADSLGVTEEHINRVLKQLRVHGLLTFRRSRVIFDDFDRLVELADFNVSYLDQDGPLLT